MFFLSSAILLSFSKISFLLSINKLWVKQSMLIKTSLSILYNLMNPYSFFDLQHPTCPITLIWVTSAAPGGSGVTVLLSLCVFSQLINDTLPQTSEAVPLLGQPQQLIYSCRTLLQWFDKLLKQPFASPMPLIMDTNFYTLAFCLGQFCLPLIIITFIYFDWHLSVFSDYFYASFCARLFAFCPLVMSRGPQNALQFRPARVLTIKLILIHS